MRGEKFVLKPEWRQRLLGAAGSIPDLYLFVDTGSQTLSLIKGARLSATYSVSTSKFGIGNQKDSFKTPLGIHRVIEKYGAGCPSGRIFKDREDTGKDWSRDITDENLILSRILRLDGLEPGINREGSIDSYERYIYIHGTNQEPLIGTPASHGCVCMKNNDVIELFDKVPEKTIVIIS